MSKVADNIDENGLIKMFLQTALFVCSSVPSLVCLSVCLCVLLSMNLSVGLSVCLCVCLFFILTGA